MSEGEAERCSQKGRGARSCQYGFKNSKQIERKYENDDAQKEDEICIRKLEPPPGNFATRGFERYQQGRQTDKPCKNPPGKSDSTTQDFLAALPRMLNETENLERDDWQNAWHQVQNDSAQKTKKEKG